MIRKDKHTGRPLNPTLGDVWREPYTRELRIWNGKLWAETTPATMMADIQRIKKGAKDNAK